VLYQRPNIISPFPQGRQHDRKNVQPIVEIATKFLFLHHLPQILISSCDETHVNLKGAVASQAFELLFLKNAEELWLQFERQISDFIKKQRAAVSRLKSSHRLSDGAGESASFVTEKLALKQGARNCCTIECNKPVRTARAGFVNCLCNDFFAGPRLTSDQDGTIHRRNHVYLIKDGPELRAGSNQI
jgi:hypothetical protein